MQFDMPGGETGEGVEGKEAGEREWRMGGRGQVGRVKENDEWVPHVGSWDRGEI
jgi:hypothetical protein